MHAKAKAPSSKALFVMTCIAFACCVALHIILGDFPKAIDVLPDERRYLEIARSLFTGNGLIMRGAASDFQKIAYPVSLFPALFFEDGQAQIRAIGVLNSIYAASAVFPAFLLARKIFNNPWAILASVAFTLITPDLMYSMTFMSESLFMPLALWLTYACWRSFEAHGPKSIAMSGAVGVLCYVTYLCKEVSLMFLIAFLTWHLFSIGTKRTPPRHAIACMSAFIAGFVVPFVILKLTLFAGLFNSYAQFSFDILLSPYTTLFGLYSVLNDSLYFIVGFGVFPVLFVACSYSALPRNCKSLAFFCLVSLAVGLAVVVFTISMREDVGHVALRQHLRYVAPLALPLLMVFIKQVARLDAASLMASPGKRALYVSVFSCFCVFVALAFGAGNLQQGFDFAQFHFMRWHTQDLSTLAPEYFDPGAGTLMPIGDDDGDLLEIVPLIWAARAAIVAFTALGAFLLVQPRERTRLVAGGLICSIVAAFMVANSCAMANYNANAYDVEPQKISEISAISDELASLPEESQVLVVLDAANTGPNNLIDTYLQDGAGAYHYQVIDSLLPQELENADYVLAHTSQKLDIDKDRFEKMEIEATQDGQFVLYSRKD